MKKKEILIFDDDSGQVEKWAAKLGAIEAVKKNYEPYPMDMTEFGKMVEVLNGRRREARHGGETPPTAWDEHIDRVAILIVDYDLLELNRVDFVTAEQIAYLARCYSRCGLIVILNQWVKQYGGKNPFDLTLRGHPTSYADINLGDQQISNPGLWQEPWVRFRPWVWPLLPDAVEAYENRIRELQTALDEPILSFLGMQEIASLLPRSTMEFIEAKAGERSERPGLEKITFRHFVLESQQGLQSKDKPANEESISRIAAARVHKWLERFVWTGQDILVDAPHLVARFPSLLKGDPNLTSDWDRTVSFKAPGPAVMRTNLIAPFAFAKTDWLSRPCWFWGAVSGCEAIDEVRNPWNTAKKRDVVFCEDVSKFMARSNAREFTADLPSPFVRRFVRGLKNVDYQPLVRFAM